LLALKVRRALGQGSVRDPACARSAREMPASPICRALVAGPLGEGSQRVLGST